MDALGLDVIRSAAVIQNYFCLAALVVLVLDYVHTLKGEIRYIWSLPLNQTKFTFLFARYFAIGFQSINVVLSIMRTTKIPVPYATCKHWYVQQVCGVCTQYAASQMVLSHKVFNLYGRSRRIGAALGVLHLGEVTVIVVTAERIFRTFLYDPACNGLEVPKNLLVFLAAIMFSQVVLWSLICRKLWSPNTKDPPSRVDLRAGICRIWYEGDAKWTWFLLSIAYAFAIPHSLIHQHVKPFLVFSWPISLLSIGTCRHILSIERVARTRARLSPPGLKQDTAEPMTQSSHTTELEVSGDSTRQVRCSQPTPSNIPSIPSILLSNPGDSVSSLECADSLSIHSAGNASIVSDTSLVSASMRSSNSATSCDRRSRESLESEQTDVTVESFDTSSADIEIGSIHTTSSMNSQELRVFWNEAWNDGSEDTEWATPLNSSSRGV